MTVKEITNLKILARIKEINDALTDAVKAECPYFDVWMKLYDGHILTLEITDGYGHVWVGTGFDLCEYKTEDVMGDLLIKDILHEIYECDFIEEAKSSLDAPDAPDFMELAMIATRFQNIAKNISIRDFKKEGKHYAK